MLPCCDGEIKLYIKVARVKAGMSPLSGGGNNV